MHMKKIPAPPTRRNAHKRINERKDMQARPHCNLLKWHSLVVSSQTVTKYASTASPTPPALMVKFLNRRSKERMMAEWTNLQNQKSHRTSLTQDNTQAEDQPETDQVDGNHDL